ncbi:unnamed protein product [Brachionus calyciflorus]|uniref:Uncharacterized protein n=1 Tax=Brachionus calyciflorus TaxID=104777 RepID=A0A813PCX3_9BILA|nr:unnamed protein product [Brachionus calyciflorus]
MQNKNKIEALLKIDKFSDKIDYKNKKQNNISRNGYYKSKENYASLYDLSNKTEKVPKFTHTSTEFNAKYQKTDLDLSKNRSKSTDKKMNLTKSIVNNSPLELKRIQRNQIYALNQLMTKLEHDNFVEFSKRNGLNFTIDSD